MVRTDNSLQYYNQFDAVKSVNFSQELVQSRCTSEHPFSSEEINGVIDRSKLDKAVEGLNKTMDVVERALEFSVHEDTNRIIVRVIDRSNYEEEIIREIPPEKILNMVAVFMDMIGLMFDQRV